MLTCTFFGHRDTPASIQPFLEKCLRELIENHAITRFLVGNQGNFDRMVLSTLKKVKIDYSYINITVVLAYMPGKKGVDGNAGVDTVFPETLETAPPQYAICKRNLWMLERAEYVVTYVTRPFGGAAHYKKEAERRKKHLIDIAIQETTHRPVG